MKLKETSIFVSTKLKNIIHITVQHMCPKHYIIKYLSDIYDFYFGYTFGEWSVFEFLGDSEITKAMKVIYGY